MGQDAEVLSDAQQIASDVASIKTDVQQAITLLQGSNSQSDPQVAAAIKLLQGAHGDLATTDASLKAAVTAATPLAVDQKSLAFSLVANAPATLTATGGVGPYSAASDNAAIATVAPGPTLGTFVVTALAVGTCNVTISDATTPTPQSVVVPVSVGQ